VQKIGFTSLYLTGFLQYGRCLPFHLDQNLSAVSNASFYRFCQHALSRNGAQASNPSAIIDLPTLKQSAEDNLFKKTEKFKFNN